MKKKDTRLIERFQEDPEGAYDELLQQFTPMMLHVIGRFISDQDETMEVYTSICERLRADDFRALRRFQVGSDSSLGSAWSSPMHAEIGSASSAPRRCQGRAEKAG